ncbi:MAG: hypothetical protein H6742_07125 [Alphaproteobacteria bacterium]|nr:hypothetical protein [Alphaproteobacteria bacterium]
MRASILLLAASSALFLACGDKDDTGGLPTGTPPDVAGSYQAFIGGTSGCEGVSDWIDGWATGPLKVEGSGGVLSFDFGDDYVFDGGVDSYGRYYFSGTIQYNDAELVVDHEGSFEKDTESELERWLMDGEFEVEVDDDEFDSNNCTITGRMQATELVDL